RSPAELQTVQQVAARARVDRRTFERWFLRLGLRSPRHFLAAARVLHAHRLLQDPGFTVDDVAQRLGYAQTKTLQLHARAYLGLTLGEMRDALDAKEALQRVAARRGYLVRRAETGVQALEQVFDQGLQAGPDLIVLDDSLPDIDPFDASRALRDDPRVGSGVPILLVTAGKPTTAEHHA